MVGSGALAATPASVPPPAQPPPDQARSLDLERTRREFPPSRPRDISLVAAARAALASRPLAAAAVAASDAGADTVPIVFALATPDSHTAAVGASDAGADADAGTGREEVRRRSDVLLSSPNAHKRLQGLCERSDPAVELQNVLRRVHAERDRWWNVLLL